MFTIQRCLIGALVLLGICFGEVSSVCYGDDLCFPNDLPCWQVSHMYNTVPNPGDPDDLDNHFYLYNRAIAGGNQCDDATPEELSWEDNGSLDGYDDQLKTVVIVHGFKAEYQDDYIIGLCDAFLEESDVNIIMVDWKKAAKAKLFYPVMSYLESRQNSRVIGRELGKLLERLHDEEGLQYADVHMVGHSLGAHLAGLAGEYLGGQIGRITGLDPAGPDFRNFLSEPQCNLDKSDAQFVDVIHSDGSAYLYGLKESIGHQDFFPNHGDSWQPGCLLKVACSHLRAVDLFTESLVNSGDSSEGCWYPTTRCDSDVQCGQEGCPVMGILAGVGDDGDYCLRSTCY